MLRVTELASRHGVPVEFILEAFRDLGVTGRFFPDAIIEDHTVRAFEDEWAERLRKMAPEQRAALKSEAARIAVTIPALIRETGLDRQTTTRYLRELGVQIQWVAGREDSIRPDEAERFKAYATTQSPGEPGADQAPSVSMAPRFENPFTGRPRPAVGSVTERPVDHRRPDRVRRPRQAEDLRHLSIEEAAKALAAESKRGKVHRGIVDRATQHWLDQMGFTRRPPFLDDYDRAWAEIKQWYTVGFDADQIIHWRENAPGVRAEQAWEFHLAGVGPDLLATRWNGKGIDPTGGYTLRQSIVGHYEHGVLMSRLGPEDAIWLLRQAKLVA